MTFHKLATTFFVPVCAGALAVGLHGQLHRARAVGEDRSAAWTRVYAGIDEHFGSLKLAKS